MNKEIEKIKVWHAKVHNRMAELYNEGMENSNPELVENSPLYHKRLAILMNISINDIIKEAEELEEYEMVNDLLYIKNEQDPDWYT